MFSIIKEMAEPSKRQILLELRTGPKSVNELVDLTGLKQPNVSNHLSKLRTKGLIKAMKIGRQVFYSLANPEVEAALVGLIDRPNEDPVQKIDLDIITKQYARAAVNGDEQACTKFIDQLIRNGTPLISIYQNVLAEAMGFVGKWYEVEAIDIGQEHLASAITERMMARVVHYAPPVRSADRIAVTGCVAGNQHTIGARMISDFMRLSGWRVLYLGANTPLESFLSMIKEHKPSLVLLSVAFTSDRQEVIRALTEFGQLDNRKTFKVGIGGGQVRHEPEVFLKAGADFTAPNLSVFAEEILPKIL